MKMDREGRHVLVVSTDTTKLPLDATDAQLRELLDEMNRATMAALDATERAPMQRCAGKSAFVPPRGGMSPVIKRHIVGKANRHD